MVIRITQTGNFSKTTNFLTRALRRNYMKVLDKYGRRGVDALANATPIDTGYTASAWNYKIENQNGEIEITWTNSNVVNGVSIAIILQYGHGTRNGGYVQGRDYINPALQPVFDEMAEEVWMEVIKE